MKKKALIYGLCLALTLSVVGCGSQQAQEPQQGQETQNVQQIKESVPPTQPEAQPTEVKRETDAPAAPVEDGMKDNAGTVGEAGGSEGAGKEESTAPDVDVELFTDCNETVYATGTVNLRNGPSTDNDKVGSLTRGKSATRIGIGIKDTEAEGWSLVKLSDGSIVYVSSKYLSTTKPVTQQNTSKPSSKQSQQSQQNNKTPQPQGGGQQQDQQQTQQQQSGNQQQTQQPTQPKGGNPLAERNKRLEEQGYGIGDTQWTDEERAEIGKILSGG